MSTAELLQAQLLSLGVSERDARDVAAITPDLQEVGVSAQRQALLSQSHPRGEPGRSLPARACPFAPPTARRPAVCLLPCARRWSCWGGALTGRRRRRRRTGGSATARGSSASTTTTRAQASRVARTAGSVRAPQGSAAGPLSLVVKGVFRGRARCAPAAPCAGVSVWEAPLCFVFREWRLDAELYGLGLALAAALYQAVDRVLGEAERAPEAGWKVGAGRAGGRAISLLSTSRV